MQMEIPMEMSQFCCLDTFRCYIMDTVCTIISTDRLVQPKSRALMTNLIYFIILLFQIAQNQTGQCAILHKLLLLSHEGAYDILRVHCTTHPCRKRRHQVPPQHMHYHALLLLLIRAPNDTLFWS